MVPCRGFHLLSPRCCNLCTFQISAEQLAQAAERRCAAVRAKDAAARTREENEWVEIDKKLYPDIWRLKHRQEDRRANVFLPSCFEAHSPRVSQSRGERFGSGQR